MEYERLSGVPPAASFLAKTCEETDFRGEGIIRNWEGVMRIYADCANVFYFIE